MLKISLFLSESKRIESFIFSSLILCFLITSILNCGMSLSILECQVIGDFLSLFDSFWINHAFISKIVLRLMQYVYTSGSVLFIILSCFSLMDYIISFGSFLFLLQISSGGKFKLHQNWIFLLFFTRFFAFAGLLVFLFMAITSLTTAKGFFHLKAGAVFYLILNVFCIGLIALYVFNIINKIFIKK